MGYGTAAQYEKIEGSECANNAFEDKLYGGGWANAVFSNRRYVSVYHYVGCYRDDGARDLNEGPMQTGYDPNTCLQACASYPYYSLQNGGECFCGMGYGTAPQYEEIESSFCSKNSQKDRYYGGGWANSVFCNDDYIEILPEPEPELPEECFDSDVCLQNIPGWGEEYTCAGFE